MWNGDPLALTNCIKHRCYVSNGCNCLSVEDTCQKMSRDMIQSLFLRRPRKPEVKEWKAVGAMIVLFERFVGGSFLPLVLTVVWVLVFCV